MPQILMMPQKYTNRRNLINQRNLRETFQPAGICFADAADYMPV
jgi:hypothetical protein